MKRILLSLFMIAFSGFLFLSLAQEKKAVGNWAYEVSQAPYGYEKGNIKILSTDKRLVGEVSFYGGYKVKLQDIVVKSDTLKARAFVEGENISIVAKIVNEKMDGKVDTSMGVMPLKATKIKPEPTINK